MANRHPPDGHDSAICDEKDAVSRFIDVRVGLHNRAIGSLSLDGDTLVRQNARFGVGRIGDVDDVTCSGTGSIDGILDGHEIAAGGTHGHRVTAGCPGRC